MATSVNELQNFSSGLPVCLSPPLISVYCSHMESICMKIHMHDVTFWPSLLYWRRVTAINTRCLHLNKTMSCHKYIMQNVLTLSSLVDTKSTMIFIRVCNIWCKINGIIKLLQHFTLLSIKIRHVIPYSCCHDTSYHIIKDIIMYYSYVHMHASINNTL